MSQVIPSAERINELIKSGDARALKRLITSGKIVSAYPLLASGSDDIFSLLLTLDIRKLPARISELIILKAAQHKDAPQRLNALYEAGYDFTDKTLSDKHAKVLEKRQYAASVSGTNLKRSDEAVVRLLRTLSEKERKKPANPRLNLIIYIAASLLIACLIGLGIGYSLGKNVGNDINEIVSEAAEATESTEEAE